MRFLKLELTWDASPWVHVLSDGAQLAWLKLLTYCKASGTAGVVKRLEPEYAARIWLKGEEDIRKMEAAAIKDGALVVHDGNWVVVNWNKYQGDETASERMRRMRDRLKKEENVTDVTRNSRGVTLVTENENENENENEIPPKPPKGGNRPSETEFFDYGNEINLPNQQIETAWDHYTSNGWKVGRHPVKDWRACLRNWKRRWEERA